MKKISRRIEAIGTVDELNSIIGLLLTRELPEEIRANLTDVQHDLFDLGGELSIPGRAAITENQVKRLETALDELNADLPPLKEFILPGGNEAASVCHLARSVCRRAERDVLRLGEEEEIGTAAKKYLNRLSDLFFVMARWENKSAGIQDFLWRNE